MNFISVIKAVPATAAAKMGPLGVKLSAKAPEILMVSGMVSIGGGTVYACKKTLDVKEILEDGISTAEAMKLNGEPEVAIKKQHLATGAKVAASYVLPAVLIGGGMAMIGMSHGIMSKRLVEAVGAANAYQLALEQYRKRVAGELGESKELELYRGGAMEKREVYQEKEDGSVKKVKMEVKIRNDDGFPDPYMVRFGRDTSTEWQSENYRNIDFVQTVETLATRQLMVKGRLFLREVTDQLGLKYRPVDAVSGWVLGNGDDCVIIEIDESYSEEELELAKEEMRPPVPDLWLKFNCEGNIVNID